MATTTALVAYNSSELLTLRHRDPATYNLIRRSCTTKLQELGHLSDSVEIDHRYLLSELEAYGISVVVLAAYDLPSILGLISARIERTGRRFSMYVQRPYLTERATFYGVPRYEVYSALRQGCLRYVLEHLILFRLDTLPPVREIEWWVQGTKRPDRFRVRGTALVRM